MAGYKCKIMPDCVWGRMPCGEARRFATEAEYAEAYRFEENDIIEGLAELEEARQAYYRMVEYPPYEYA